MRLWLALTQSSWQNSVGSLFDVNFNVATSHFMNGYTEILVAKSVFLKGDVQMTVLSDSLGVLSKMNRP